MAKARSAKPAISTRRVSSRDLPSIPTGLASLALRALGGPNANGGARPLPDRFDEQDLYRLEQVRWLLDSARRGSQGLRGLAESRKALAATASRSRRPRYPTMSQDVATARLVKQLLGTEDAGPVISLAEGIASLLDTVRAGSKPTKADRQYIDSALKPFLYRLAHAEDPRHESVPGRHVLRA